MIELKQCCKVPFPERLHEQYEVSEKVIRANVSASKVFDMMTQFIEDHQEPLFFVLEIPSNQRDEENASGDEHRLHSDVYYMDGLDKEYALHMLEAVGHFLIKDGLNTFGFAGHRSDEEILFGKYNVLTVYTANAEKYREFFAKFGIERTDKLVTAWDTFDQEHPGECTRYESEGKTIFDIPEVFKEFGLYFAEKRGDNDTLHNNEIALDEMIGKVMLIGVTYYSHENEFIEQKQFWGTIIEASEKRICIKQKSGELFSLPPDLSSTQRALPGEYRLRSTGEVVINPDYLTTWNVVQNK